MHTNKTERLTTEHTEKREKKIIEGLKITEWREKAERTLRTKYRKISRR